MYKNSITSKIEAIPQVRTYIVAAINNSKLGILELPLQVKHTLLYIVMLLYLPIASLTIAQLPLLYLLLNIVKQIFLSLLNSKIGSLACLSFLDTSLNTSSA